jgi:hypothetical protein
VIQLQADLRRAVVYGLAAGACSFLIQLLTVVLGTVFSRSASLYVPGGGDILHAFRYGIPVFVVVLTVFAVAPSRALPLLLTLGSLVWCYIFIDASIGPPYRLSWLERAEYFVEPFLKWTKYFAPLGLLMVITNRGSPTPKVGPYALAVTWSLVYVFVLWVARRWVIQGGLILDPDPLAPWEDLLFSNAVLSFMVKTLTMLVLLLWPIVVALVGLRHAARSRDQATVPSAA